MLGPLVAAENQRFLYIVTRGTRLDLHHSRKVRYHLSGRQGDELNNGAMAQLVARFHGMEEVGGSNPPSSTKNSDTQLVSVGFLLSLDGSFVCCAGTRWPGLKDKKSWSEPDLSALRCEKVWFKVVGGQL